MAPKTNQQKFEESMENISLSEFEKIPCHKNPLEKIELFEREIERMYGDIDNTKMVINALESQIVVEELKQRVAEAENDHKANQKKRL